MIKNNEELDLVGILLLLFLYFCSVGCYLLF